MGAYESYKIIKDDSAKELQDKVRGAVDSGFKKLADKKAEDEEDKDNLPSVNVGKSEAATGKTK
jgi:hypothetical protein